MHGWRLKTRLLPDTEIFSPKEHINPEKRSAYNFFRRNEFRSARHLNGPNLLSATRKHTNTKLHINHLSFQKLQRLDSIAKQKVVRSWYFHGQLKKQLFKKDERNVSILTIVPFFLRCIASSKSKWGFSYFCLHLKCLMKILNNSNLEWKPLKSHRNNRRHWKIDVGSKWQIKRQ